MGLDAAEALQLQTSVMQAVLNVVNRSYGACVLCVEGQECFSGHLCCRCCHPKRRCSTGVAFLRAAAA